MSTGRVDMIREGQIDKESSERPYQNDKIEETLKRYFELENKQLAIDNENEDYTRRLYEINGNQDKIDILNKEHLIKIDNLQKNFTPTEQIEYENFKEFFSILKDDKGVKKYDCNGTPIISCFKLAYSEALAIIKNYNRPLDEIVSDLMKLIDSSMYDPKSPEFLKFLNMIKTDIVIARGSQMGGGGSGSGSDDYYDTVTTRKEPLLSRLSTKDKIRHIEEWIEYLKTDKDDKNADSTNIRVIKKDYSEHFHKSNRISFLVERIEKTLGDQETARKNNKRKTDELNRNKREKESKIQEKQDEQDNLIAVKNEEKSERYYEGRSGMNLTLRISTLTTDINRLKKELEAINAQIAGYDVQNDTTYEKLKVFYEKLIKELEKYKAELENNSKPTIMRAVTKEGDDPGSSSLYSKVWNHYLNNLDDSEKIIEESQEGFYKSVKNNNLDPQVALRVSRDDKIIFVIIMFVVRQITLSIIDALVDRGILTSVLSCLHVYLGIYFAFFLVIVLIINLDDYKLRIVFNYFNMHANMYGILGHVFTMVGITYIIYFVIYYLNENINNVKNEITEVEKMNLMYKLQLITIAVFMVVAIITVLV